MITALVDDIDQDVYCYDTGMEFGVDIGKEIIEAINKDLSIFPRRYNYNIADDPVALAKSIGAKKTRELLRRKQQVLKYWPDAKMINFTQHHFNDYFRDRLLSVTPDWLKVTAEEPNCMLQISSDGNILPPHRGHNRQCSLLMLLESDNQETRWFRPTAEFELIDPLRIPDLDKIEQVISAVMQPGRWYLFNNAYWHSVHKYVPGKRRISMGLDFYSIDTQTLLKLIQKNTQSIR